MQVHLYPETPAAEEQFAKLAPTLRFAVRAGEAGHKSIMGHEFTLNTAISNRYLGVPTWSLALGPDEEVISVIKPTTGPIASLGKVLGNRTTLYKYLNPHLTAYITASPSPTPQERVCSIYVVDTAKGTTVYQEELPSMESGACDVKAVLSENWLVYVYYDPEYAAVGSTKGWRLVSVELYEGSEVDDKQSSPDASSYNSVMDKLQVIEQSFVLPRGINALALSKTKFGVTTKNLITAGKDNKVYDWSRRLLDPRRTKDKPTAEQAEEFLIQYDPLLPEDPRRALSHLNDVVNARGIVTAPSLLESTSLVFVYGLDLFLSRVTPSNTFDVLNENFNKVQLILTISGLAVAIMITKPMVRRKRLREKWYQ